MTPSEAVLRRAVPEDAPALADVHLRSRAAAPMPPSVHPDSDCEPWLRGHLEDPAQETWLAEVDGAPVAYLRLTPTWLDDLYVTPSYAGQGLGTALLDLAKTLRPDGFGLWVFEVNTPARAFYRRHGLVEVERTDGRANEERDPDVRLAFRP